MIIKNKYINLLSKLTKPLGAYDSFSYANGLGKISGQFPKNSEGLFIEGSFGNDVSLVMGQKAAELVGLNIIRNLYELKKELDELKLLHIDCYIQSIYNDQRVVDIVNITSLILQDALGKSGNHSRSLVIVEDLPFNSMMEIVTTFSYNNKDKK